MTTTDTTTPALSVTETETEHPCACQRVHVEGEDLRCVRYTKRTFAPGHDAKLKSRLIRAGFQGLAVHVLQADGTAQLVSVAEAAGAHGFGYQVAAGIVRLQRQANEKNQRKAARDAVREANAATREAAKAEREVARVQAKRAKDEAKTPELVAAKVGRWEVQGTVGRDGSLSYTTKKGAPKVAKKGTYTLLGV